MLGLSSENVEEIRGKYGKGVRVELVSMEDTQAPPIGTLGTVTSVDDSGNIHVRWDTGSGLALVPFQDRWHKLV